MSKEFIDEREFELINIIGRDLGSNQRDLSRHLELSLGQTNMLIRRLVAKGLIRISQLNKKKVQYLLTPKGLSEKLRKSVKYTRHTLNAIGLIKDHLREIFIKLYQDGHRNFYVYSEGDLQLLIDSAFKDAKLPEAHIVDLKETPQENLGGFLLIGRENVDLKGFNLNNHLDLVEEVAKKNHLIVEKMGS
jgi:DNA-binding MarR family transcriptional regulator